ncbi:MAG: HEAT repeat domain-containing protein, partial [Vicinamibacterales bacterium]
DPNVRLRALRMLAATRYPEAAEPIAALLNDPENSIQLEAMRGELNIFLAEPLAPRRRVALVFERRGTMRAEDVFDAGPLMVGGQLVPEPVFAGLRGAIRDADTRVALEAVYTVGILGPAGVAGEWRGDIAAALIEVLQHPEPDHRVAGLRAIGRFLGVPGRRASDTSAGLGDAVLQSLDDRNREVRFAAMEALADLRYDRGVQVMLDRFSSNSGGDEGDALLGALASIGHSSSSTLFIDLLEHGSTARKRRAVEGLARTGESELLTVIDARLGRETDRALALAGAFARARLAGGPLDPIVSALMRPEQEEQAFEYLVDLVPVRTRDLAVYARDPDVVVRGRLAEAVALAGEPGALPLVEPLVNDSEPGVADAARRAVAWLQVR